MRFIFLFLLFIFHLQSSQEFDVAMGKSTTHWQHLNEQGEKLIKLVENCQQNWLSETPQLKIPKKIHIIWIGPKNFPLESLVNMESWKSIQPEWEMHFWSDRKRVVPIEGMIFHLVDELDFSYLKKRYIDSNNYAEKSDILRFLILNQEGGVYIDHDAFCLKSFNDLHHAYDFYVALEAPHEPIAGYTVTFGISIIGSRANHPILHEILKSMDNTWDEVSRKFSNQDPMTKYQLVMNRTYIHSTLVVEDVIKNKRYLIGAFPASYFYPVEGMNGIFAKNLFSNTWYFYGDYKKQTAHIEKMLKVGKEVTYLWRLALGVLILALVNVFYFFYKQKVS